MIYKRDSALINPLEHFVSNEASFGTKSKFKQWVFEDLHNLNTFPFASDNIKQDLNEEEPFCDISKSMDNSLFANAYGTLFAFMFNNFFAFCLLAFVYLVNFFILKTTNICHFFKFFVI